MTFPANPILFIQIQNFSFKWPPLNDLSSKSYSLYSDSEFLFQTNKFEVTCGTFSDEL